MASSESSALGSNVEILNSDFSSCSYFDGKHHPEEKTLLESYKQYHPTIRSMKQQDIDTEVQAFWTKREAGMEDADIIDGLGKQLSEDEKKYSLCTRS